MNIESFPIARLGQCTIDTPLDRSTPFTADEAQVFYDREADGARTNFAKNGLLHAFEKAGPREKLFFDATRPFSLPEVSAPDSIT